MKDRSTIKFSKAFQNGITFIIKIKLNIKKRHKLINKYKIKCNGFPNDLWQTNYIKI